VICLTVAELPRRQRHQQTLLCHAHAGTGNKKGESEALEEQEFEEEEERSKKKNKTGTQSTSFPLSSVYAVPLSVARLITVQLKAATIMGRAQITDHAGPKKSLNSSSPRLTSSLSSR